jgi:CHAD domain-containing protein
LAVGKWIEDLTPQTPTQDAARRVLGVRLDTIREFLPLALREPEKDSEYVHQLRVGTRRTRAALDIFSCCLSPRIYKRAKREMRDLRRAAGLARDWDVFLAELAERARQRAPRRSRAGLDFLTGFAMAHRLNAQTTLEQAVPDPFAQDRLTADILHAIRAPVPGLDTLLHLAQPTLLGLLEELDRTAEADLENYDNLHQVRIAGKRLRYAMEVFASCFDCEFRTQHYADVEQMQEILGQTNDSHVACRRLDLLREKIRTMLPDQWKRCKGDLNELHQYHAQRLAQGLPHFKEWWENWHNSGRRAALLELLEADEPTAIPVTTQLDYFVTPQAS